MVYNGIVKNGLVVFEGDIRPPEGSAVCVSVIASNGEPRGEVAPAAPTIWDRLLGLAGSVEGLPPDAARNIDHYLYGHPKR